MKAKLLLSVCASALTLASLPAMATTTDGERWPRWYAGVSGGVSFLEDSDISGTATGEADFNTGWGVNGQLGYRPYFGGGFENLRLELEAGYHRNDIGGARLGGAPVTTSGDVATRMIMANALLDIPINQQWTPYLGAGAGWAHTEVGTNSGFGNLEDSDSGFAYQFLAGIAYAPETIPLTEWTLGYRYLNVNGPEFRSAGGSIEVDDLTSHNVEVGARFRF